MALKRHQHYHHDYLIHQRHIWVWAFVCVLSFFISQVSSSTDSVRTCEPIRIEMCRGLGYNVTGMPNMVGHELQGDAELQLQTFTPLIQYGCSSQLRFFLCAVYTPMCTDKVPQSIGPCRPLCENVKARCQPVLQEFGFPWPPALNCSKFPSENNHRHMCMEGPEPEDHERVYSPTNIGRGGSSHSHSHSHGHHGRRTKPKHKFHGETTRPSFTSVVNNQYPHSGMDSRKHHYGLCLEYKYFDQYYYINRTERCAHNCSADILFTSDNKNFANIWILVWASLCFISTFFTLLTFFMDSSRFRYPERAIIFLAANYLFYSGAYIIRLIIGRNDISCHIDSQHNVPILIQEGLDNANCTIIFVLLYFFGMASAVWWVILTITWFLATACNWSPDNIERKCTYFHIIGWGLPSLKTIAILVMRVVDADELTGTCYVGNQSRSTLMGFVIVPTVAYLSIGALFLIAGVCGQIRARNRRVCQTCIIPPRVRHGSHHSSSSHVSYPQLLSQHSSICHHGPQQLAEKLEVLMVRIGIFALFYTVPATCVLGANLYEYASRDSWYSVTTSASDRPNVEIFTLKIFMSLVVGIKTGLWIWSSKTPLTTWRKVGKRLVNKKQPIPVYLQATATAAALQSSSGTNGVNQKLMTIERSKRPRVKGGNETAV